MRKLKWNILILAPALALTFLCAQATAAPRPMKQEHSEQATNKPAATDINNYRVKYKVDEVENSKTINSRSYTMMVKTGSSATVRIGSRVPYFVGEKQFLYQNVGLNIGCKISREEGRLIVHTKVDMSSVQGKLAGGAYVYEANPVFGQFQVENSAVVNLGKPAFVGSADDVASNRHYEIHVTVTRAD